MNNFQTILVAIFLAFFVFAVLIFSGILKIGSDSKDKAKPIGKVVIWGTFNNSPEFSKVFEDTNSANMDLSISYSKKNESTYEKSLIEAFASGNGPDLFFMTPAMIQKFSNFVYKIPFANYPQKSFTNSFIDGGSIYLASDGVIAFPTMVDPMVLYYNRDMLSNEGIVSTPTTWDELFDLNSKLTKKKSDGTILQSMIALGRYDNISHAKEILATLLLQSNNPIIKPVENSYAVTLNDNPASLATPPVEQILNFFTEFSNPSTEAYSWNKSLDKSIDAFTGGKLAFYLGSASELFKIESTNPNLSFDVTDMLQTKGTNIKRTYGNIYAIAVNKKSANITTAFTVAGMMSAGDMAKNLATAVSLPPASRTLLASKPTDSYLSTFFNSAIISRAWLDPDLATSDAIFNEMIQNILSNRLSTSDAVAKAQGQLEFANRK
jgi:ABC-type glycerol-3-phosphate transport system substrate-binding protein